MGLARGVDGQGELGVCGPSVSCWGMWRSLPWRCVVAVSQVVLTTSASSLILIPCLAGRFRTPALPAGPPKGATQDYCHSVNDGRYKAKQSREGLETQQQADSS